MLLSSLRCRGERGFALLSRKYSENYVWRSLRYGALECLAQSRGPFGEDVGDLGEVAVGGGLRQAEPRAEAADVGLIAEPCQGRVLPGTSVMSACLSV